MIDKQPLPNQPKVMIATSVGKMFEDKYNGIPIFVCEKCLTNIDIEKVMNTMK